MGSQRGVTLRVGSRWVAYLIGRVVRHALEVARLVALVQRQPLLPVLVPVKTFHSEAEVSRGGSAGGFQEGSSRPGLSAHSWRW